MWLVNTALRHPYTVWVGMLLVAVCGLVSYFKTPTDILPSLNVPVVVIFASYRGMPAPDMEQSVVAVLDLKKKWLGRGYEVWTHNGTRDSGRTPEELVERFQEYGVGEIVINSIEHDGMMTGYDLELVERLRTYIRVPYTVLGGAGSIAHVRELYSRFGIVGAAAGSLFVFKGALRAVLINYPSTVEKEALFASLSTQPRSPSALESPAV